MSLRDDILAEVSGEVTARIMHTTVGELGPEQLMHKALWLLDATMKSGGEVEPCARQVCALTLLALEKLCLGRG